MSDIEDLLVAGSSAVSSCCAEVAAARNPHPIDAPPFVGDSFLPGTKSIFVKTWGCAHNSSDSEYMAGQLAAAGYQITGRSPNVIFGIIWHSMQIQAIRRICGF